MALYIHKQTEKDILINALIVTEDFLRRML